MRGSLAASLRRRFGANVPRRHWPRSSSCSPPPPSSSSSSCNWRMVAERGCKFATGYTAVAPKTLDSIIKVEALKHATPQEITSIWNEHHIGRGHISAVIGSEQFAALQHRAKKCPLFVIPVKRSKGYISLLMQAQMPYILFTGLEDYKRRGTAAAPYFTVTHYSELAESKGLVLARGDIVFVSKLSDEEARSLLQLAHSFYLEDSRFKLVEDFNKRSDEFEFQDVLKEIGLPVGF